MPRSIQQLKHRTIFLDGSSIEQMNQAVHVLKSLPGVAASMAPDRCNVVVDYWVDEYTYSGLEQTLQSQGVPLSCAECACAMRAEIQRDEIIERDDMGVEARTCRFAGVFAQVYCPYCDETIACSQLV